MNTVITAKIDCTKIDKRRLFEGSKGAKYLDIVLIPVSNSRYGDDYLVVQGVTKEERANGVKGNILGNGKIMGGRNGNAPQQKEPEPEVGDDQVPF